MWIFYNNVEILKKTVAKSNLQSKNISQFLTDAQKNLNRKKTNTKISNYTKGTSLSKSKCPHLFILEKWRFIIICHWQFEKYECSKWMSNCAHDFTIYLFLFSVSGKCLVIVWLLNLTCKVLNIYFFWGNLCWKIKAFRLPPKYKQMFLLLCHDYQLVELLSRP